MRVFMSSILVLTSDRRARLGRPKERASTPTTTAGFDTTTLPPPGRGSVHLTIRDPQDGVVAGMYWSDGIQMDVFDVFNIGANKRSSCATSVTARTGKYPNDYGKFRYVNTERVSLSHYAIYKNIGW